MTPFEKKTGCKASVKTFGTSDEAFQLFSTGQYDVVSASGDATLRIVANGDAAPINTELLTNYADLDAVPQGQAVEHGRRHRVRRCRTAGAPTC